MLNEVSIDIEQPKQGPAHKGCGLSKLNDQFRDFVSAQPDRLEGLTLNQPEPGQNIDNFVIDVISPWPMFIATDVKAQAAEATVALPKLVARLIKHCFAQSPQQTAQFYGIDAAMLKSALDQDIDGQIFVRTDMIFDGEQFKVLELNIGSNLGGWDIRFYDEIYRQSPTFKAFLQTGQRVLCRDPLKEMLKGVTQVAEQQKVLDDFGHCNLLFIVGDDDYGNGLGQYMRRLFAELSIASKIRVNLLFCSDKTELETVENCLYYQGKRISWMFVLNEDIGNSFLNLEAEIFNAFYANNLLLPENPLCQLIGDKRNLGLLWQYIDSGIFTDKERRLIEKYVPWSISNEQLRPVYQGKSYALPDLLEQHKDELVIKAGRGYKGNGVYVGRHCDQLQWQQAIDGVMSQSGRFVIQQHVTPSTMYVGSSEQGIFPCQTVWGAFAFAGNYAGIWARHDTGGQDSCNGVINSANGANESIVYEDAKRNSLSL